MPLAPEREISSWGEYRRVKLRLLVLLFGWLPFGLILGTVLPAVLGSYTPSYVLAIGYALVWAYTLFQYLLYPCPVCGRSYRGWNLYRRSCPRCGTVINR